MLANVVALKDVEEAGRAVDAAFTFWQQASEAEQEADRAEARARSRLEDAQKKFDELAAQYRKARAGSGQEAWRAGQARPVEAR